jgi:hypothetical protein
MLAPELATIVVLVVINSALAMPERRVATVPLRQQKSPRLVSWLP